MATVLESLAIPRSSALPRPTLSPITASSSSISYRPLKFPQAHGLKLNFTSTFLSSALHSKFSCGARIICEAQDTVVEVAPIKEDSWKSLVLESYLPVLVEFEASWCRPCRIIHPVIDELAKLYTRMLKCYKVNTDECKNIPTEYGIQSIPTVLVFKGGEKKDAVIGAVPKTTLINLSFLENNVENYLFNNSIDFHE